MLAKKKKARVEKNLNQNITQNAMHKLSLLNEMENYLIKSDNYNHIIKLHFKIYKKRL